MSKQSTFVSAEVATELRGESPGDHVREWAGLVDDKETLELLNYLETVTDKPLIETQMGQEIIQRQATETIDEAIRAGNTSQMKQVRGMTNQNSDGHDFYGEAAEQLTHEGAIGIMFGPPGAGKTATTLDVALDWRARTGGYVIGNTSYSGFDMQFSSDTEMLEAMGS
ncbi:hypothetical protein [Halovenus salina]|uniref:Uncharacterized protein n=2 Tax=Halovenus salina TaxID=1510225 RepID=A0ABD5VVY7_9EURY